MNLQLHISAPKSEWKLQEYIGYTYMLSTALSIFGSLSIIVVVLWTRKLNRRRTQVFPVFNIAVADFLASTGLFCSTVVYEVVVRNYVSPAPEILPLSPISAFNKTIEDCRLANGPVLCLYVITFLLTTAYALYWYLIMKRDLEADSHIATEATSLRTQTQPIRSQTTCIIYITAWLLPVLIAAIMGAIYEQLIVEDKGLNELFEDRLWCISGCLQVFSNGFQKCHIHVKTEHWFIAYRLVFHGILLVVTVSNLTIYYFMARMFKLSINREGQVGREQRERVKNTKNRVFWYQLIFIFCWTPSLILAIMSTIEWAQGTEHYYFNKTDTPLHYFVLYYFQAATAPLQGFLNAIIYGWKNGGFRRILSLARCGSCSH